MPSTTASRLAGLYPLTAWLALAFLLLHTGLRLVLTLETWQPAALDIASAVRVLGTGLAFDLVTLALLLPAVLAIEAALGTRTTPAGRARRATVLAAASSPNVTAALPISGAWPTGTCTTTRSSRWTATRPAASPS